MAPRVLLVLVLHSAIGEAFRSAIRNNDTQKDTTRHDDNCNGATYTGESPTTEHFKNWTILAPPNHAIGEVYAGYQASNQRDLNWRFSYTAVFPGNYVPKEDRWTNWLDTWDDDRSLSCNNNGHLSLVTGVDSRWDGHTRVFRLRCSSMGWCAGRRSKLRWTNWVDGHVSGKNVVARQDHINELIMGIWFERMYSYQGPGSGIAWRFRVNYGMICGIIDGDYDQKPCQ